MRRPRHFQTDRCYHLISRVAHRAFYLNEEERTRFVERMRRVADLRRELGVSSPNYFTSCYLTPLAAAGLIASEGAPHSPQRRYRLTAKGGKSLA